MTRGQRERHARGLLAGLLLLIAALPASARAETPKLVPIGGFTAPTYVTAPPGDAHRVLVVEQGGTIQLLRDGTRRPQPFLRVPGVLSSGERGLLSMAFAHDYGASGLFYVYYTASADGHIQVDEFRRSPDPDIAAPARVRSIISIPHPRGNHNGGQLQFGPDGFLYMGTGDGGGAGDPDRNAQNRATLLGKILRLDPRHPSGGRPYGIPAGNPFASGGGAPEVWQYGLRNPFRFSFDRQTGDEWIGDVGQDRWEEVDHASRGSGAGINWGWPACEGLHAYAPGGTSTLCPSTAPGVKPVLDYDHTGRCSVTGGYVVRDASLDTLAGSYLFGDYCSGQIYAGSTSRVVPVTVPQIVSFGEDSCGHIYAVSQGNGVVSRLQTSATGPCRDATITSSDPAVRIDHRSVRVARTGRLRVRLRCSQRAAGQCLGALALRRGDSVLARTTFSSPRGRLFAPRVRLSARGRALLRHRRRMHVQVAVRSRDASGRSVRTTARITLVA